MIVNHGPAIAGSSKKIGTFPSNCGRNRDTPLPNKSLTSNDVIIYISAGMSVPFYSPMNSGLIRVVQTYSGLLTSKWSIIMRRVITDVVTSDITERHGTSINDRASHINGIDVTTGQTLITNWPEKYLRNNNHSAHRRDHTHFCKTLSSTNNVSVETEHSVSHEDCTAKQRSALTKATRKAYLHHIDVVVLTSSHALKDTSRVCSHCPPRDPQQRKIDCLPETSICRSCGAETYIIGNKRTGKPAYCLVCKSKKIGPKKHWPDGPRTPRTEKTQWWASHDVVSQVTFKHNYQSAPITSLNENSPLLIRDRSRTSIDNKLHKRGCIARYCF